MGEVAIVIPTHGRAGSVTTFKVFPMAILCVAESQEKFYRDAYPDKEIVVHPDSVQGLASKRQWIYDYWGDVFQVDDDITAMTDLSVAAGETYKMTPERAFAVVQRTADTARQMGVHLWGFAPWEDPAMCSPMRPFRLTGFVNGHGLGLLKGAKFFWRPDMYVNNDMWIALLNMYHHRMVFVDQRFGLHHKATFHNTGGLANWRTHDELERSFNILKDHCGDAVSAKKGNARAGITHKWQPIINTQIFR